MSDFHQNRGKVDICDVSVKTIKTKFNLRRYTPGVATLNMLRELNSSKSHTNQNHHWKNAHENLHHQYFNSSLIVFRISKAKKKSDRVVNLSISLNFHGILPSTYLHMKLRR